MSESKKLPLTPMQKTMQKICIASTAIALLSLLAALFVDPEGKPLIIIQLIFFFSMIIAATTALIGKPPDKQGRRLWINQFEDRMKGKDNHKEE